MLMNQAAWQGTGLSVSLASLPCPAPALNLVPVLSDPGPAPGSGWPGHCATRSDRAYDESEVFATTNRDFKLQYGWSHGHDADESPLGRLGSAAWQGDLARNEATAKRWAAAPNLLTMRKARRIAEGAIRSLGIPAILASVRGPNGEPQQQRAMAALRSSNALTRLERAAKLKEIRETADKQIERQLTPEQAEKWRQQRSGAFTAQFGGGATNGLPRPDPPRWGAAAPTNSPATPAAVESNPAGSARPSADRLGR